MHDSARWHFPPGAPSSAAHRDERQLPASHDLVPSGRRFRARAARELASVRMCGRIHVHVHGGKRHHESQPSPGLRPAAGALRSAAAAAAAARPQVARRGSRSSPAGYGYRSRAAPQPPRATATPSRASPAGMPGQQGMPGQPGPYGQPQHRACRCPGRGRQGKTIGIVVPWSSSARSSAAFPVGVIGGGDEAGRSSTNNRGHAREGSAEVMTASPRRSRDRRAKVGRSTPAAAS